MTTKSPTAAARTRPSITSHGVCRSDREIRDVLRPGTRVLSSGLGQEEERALAAVIQARGGHAVALVGSGDAGVYAMGSPALTMAGADIDVVSVPGITAGLAAASLLGAPLGHDHALISLSDLHTPWDVIERRVRAAAAGDFVVVFYNPRSADRDWQLRAALAILAELDPAAVDMRTVVIVGSTSTVSVADRMVTPRGYRWQY